MGLKTEINIGYFDWDWASGGFTTRPPSSEVSAAIVQVGGWLLADGHLTDRQLTTIA